MMNPTEEKQKQSSLIHQKIRTASFIPIKPETTDKYKYAWGYILYQEILRIMLAFKIPIKFLESKLVILKGNIDWKPLLRDSILWVAEALIEGATANFATHILCDVQFTLWSVFAHGIVIKQGISIFWRLRRNGSTTEIPNKDN